MTANKFNITRNRFFPFKGLSIQQRLPLLICLLLLCTVVIFSWTSYMGVKNATLKTGQNRLRLLTGDMSQLFGQSMQKYLSSIRASANGDSIKKFIQSGGKDSRAEALAAISKLHQDSSSLFVEIFDVNRNPLLHSGKPGIEIKLNPDQVIKSLSILPDSARIGKIYLAGDSMYYPIVASITDKKKITGYLIKWRLVQTTPKAISQFSKLIGTNATFYIGNNDGSLWTDMMKPVSGLPVDTGQINKFFEYAAPQSSRVIASAKAIPNTPWLVVIGFSKQAMLEASNRYRNSILLIGGVLVAIGIFIAWLMSRKITSPLKQLTTAATAIAAGDYSTVVEVKRNDELGKLAAAFNVMTNHVHSARLDLEQKVQERTAQLQAANKELEAFSYSVSHDLRAPLRAISGYTRILKEEYGVKLDDEANRITDRIISNSKMMGRLIDDLIAFSQMGAKEVMYRRVEMKKLVEFSVNEMLHHEPKDKYQVHIDALPSCQGDPNLLVQVWMNLVSNAIKYSSKESKPCIEIGSTTDNGVTTYFIRDNGVGFDMQHAHKLFGVFQRLHSQKAFDGTGIGLAFAKRIITKHGGKIWAESTPGQGAIFYFSLPQIIVTKDSYDKPRRIEAASLIETENHE